MKMIAKLKLYEIDGVLYFPAWKLCWLTKSDNSSEGNENVVWHGKEYEIKSKSFKLYDTERLCNLIPFIDFLFLLACFLFTIYFYSLVLFHSIPFHSLSWKLSFYRFLFLSIAVQCVYIFRINRVSPCQKHCTLCCQTDSLSKWLNAHVTHITQIHNTYLSIYIYVPCVPSSMHNNTYTFCMHNNYYMYFTCL